MMKGPTRREETAVPKLYEAKIGKSKRNIATSLTSKSQSIPITYDEAKANCKARKRKERQESISSLCQERKVIRSNSEERPAQKMHLENKTNIRRVSSSEDFQCRRSGSSERISLSPHKAVGNDRTLAYDDHEHEKRRSHERFSRPLSLKSKKHQKQRLKIWYISRTKFKPEITSLETAQNNKNLPQGTYSSENNVKDFDKSDKQPTDERDLSPSPTQTAISPVLDLTTLHEQVDSLEPVLSQNRQVNENTETLPSLSIATNRLLSSPRNSIIATHRIYLDPDVPKAISIEHFQGSREEKWQRILKQMKSLKKRIKKYEAEFETRHGYRRSHLEHMNDKNVKKMYSELNTLRREKEEMCGRTESTLVDGESDTDSTSFISLDETLEAVEKKLTAKREASGRCNNIDEMTSDQLMDEKVAVQKALLYLESRHGRPVDRESRDLVRPLYDRYRGLKRMLSKISTTATVNELATIHENETMTFVTQTSSSQSNDTETESDRTIVPSTDSSDTDTSVDENLHSLPRSELLQQLKIVTEEKKELRRRIKEFELDMQMKTGKMIQKEEKYSIHNVYSAYKKTKAKFRLLEALLGKTKKTSCNLVL